MKKIFLALIIAMTLASCTSTINVTSFKEYDENINKVKSDLYGKGYELSGHNQESSSNTVVTGVSYSTQTGYGTAMDNDHYTYDTYTFSNANGDVAEFSVKYRGRYSSYSDVNYMQTVELLGCKTSKASDYNKICGSNSSIRPLIGNMKKDIDVQVYDNDKTWACFYLILGVACIIPLVMM